MILIGCAPPSVWFCSAKRAQKSCTRPTPNTQGKGWHAEQWSESRGTQDILTSSECHKRCHQLRGEHKSSLLCGPANVWCATTSEAFCGSHIAITLWPWHSKNRQNIIIIIMYGWHCRKVPRLTEHNQSLYCNLEVIINKKSNTTQIWLINAEQNQLN